MTGQSDAAPTEESTPELTRLRALAFDRGQQLARAWAVGVAGLTEVDPVVDPEQQAWSAMCGAHTPETLADTLIDELRRLRAERDGWQATAAGISQDISNAEDEIELLREQVAYRDTTIAGQRAEIERLIGARRG